MELADKGTLFLDEIGEMPLQLQAKLLHVLQENEFLPLGGDKMKRVDIRILAATNRDLEDMVAQKQFREDSITD
nr:sigma 54-interacting transcriptional regulator [Virgibacillus massiliensis]